MLEITYNEKNNLNEYIDADKAYFGGIYDFTFENRFIVYHYGMANEVRYIALDTKTELDSEIAVVSKEKMYNRETYKKMIPKLLYSIKYTGDNRYVNPDEEIAKENIKYIFYSVLPTYGYNVREEQVKLALSMFHGFAHKKVSLNEAEVGTGKSLAYLIASFIARKYLNEIRPITISTSSIELQRALVEKEIPNLSRMLEEAGIIDKPLTVVLRKGREHYVCPKRYSEYYTNIAKYKKYKKTIEAFDELGVLEDGFVDLDKFELRPSLKEKICVKGSCRDCAYKTKCGYVNFVERAKTVNTDYQVTNHNMYLASVKIQNDSNNQSCIMRPASVVVIDEAHKLKQAAEDSFGCCINENVIPKYAKSIKNLCSVQRYKQSYKNLLSKLVKLNEELFSSLIDRVKKEDYENEKHVKINITPIDIERLELMGEFIDEIESLKMDDESNSISIEPFVVAVRTMAEGKHMNYWIERDENGFNSFCCSPKEIGLMMYKYLWSKDIPHVLTSGTMSDGQDFYFFIEENGMGSLQDVHIQTTTTPSPFDYYKNTRLYIPKGMPFPDNDSEEYKAAVVEKIIEIVGATSGHTVILFTSYNVLNSVYEAVKDRLNKYELICMTRSNKSAISDFKKSKNAVLFASGAMWEGVDCAGDCLSSVIIVRLPFPLRSATMEQKKEKCSSLSQFVKKYAVPEMLIKLRQGVGRLIRNETDTGVISILDSRAYSGANAQIVKKVLSKYPLVESVDEIKAFFKEVKSDKYFEE